MSSCPRVCLKGRQNRTLLYSNTASQALFSLQEAILPTLTDTAGAGYWPGRACADPGDWAEQASRARLQCLPLECWVLWVPWLGTFQYLGHYETTAEFVGTQPTLYSENYLHFTINVLWLYGLNSSYCVMVFCQRTPVPPNQGAAGNH